MILMPVEIFMDLESKYLTWRKYILIFKSHNILTWGFR